ncbi:MULTISPECIES: hypothetical protein [Vibrio]|uniref:hypothetical protein n=1 Tax=Vibrio TaxID=662 RepID=UPI0013C327B5|nr:MULTISPECIES: hypothetical protein [Vibrio]MBO0208518.1 hypothetical protein [Vibrio sp. Vb0877]MCR9807388.1 hypothetical protein [Vibrio parahaemolyticus]MCY9876623.1 hypothetical protein [Vibrio natriegens]
MDNWPYSLRDSIDAQKHRYLLCHGSQFLQRESHVVMMNNQCVHHVIERVTAAHQPDLELVN